MGYVRSTPAGDWLLKRWRTLASGLWLLALVIAFWFAALPWQPWTLLLCIGGWLFLSSRLRLTGSARGAAAGAGAWTKGHLWQVTLVIVGVALASVVLAGAITSSSVGGSVAAQAFRAALVAIGIAIALRVVRLALAVGHARHKVEPSWRVGDLWCAAAVVVVGPAAVVVGRGFAAGGTPSLGWSLVGLLLCVAVGVAYLVWQNDVASRGGSGDDGGVGFLVASDREVGKGAGSSRTWYGTFGLVATALTVVSAALLILSSSRVALENLTVDESQIAGPGPTGLNPPKGPAGEVDQAIVDFYSPVLRVTRSEKWVAADAREFAMNAAATAIGKPAASCLAPADLLATPPTRRPAEDEPCLELDGDTDGYSVADVTGRPEEQVPAVFRYGTVYPRIVPATGCAPSGPCRILDYWIFYPKNEWRSASAIGDITQSHEGDWEHVAVGIDERRQPLFVAYSAHCEGVVRPWRRAPTVGIPRLREGEGIFVGDSPDHPRSHPLVIVAGGSHANYPTTGRREPNWTSCDHVGSFDDAMRRVTLQVGAVETTPLFGPIQIPTVDKLRTAQQTLRAPWAWGPDETYRLGDVGAGEVASQGPKSPSLQGKPFHDLWNEIRGWECDVPEGDPGCFARGYT